MTYKEQAELILASLNHYILVEWNFKEYYLKGIMQGLEEIKKVESAATEDDQ